MSICKICNSETKFLFKKLVLGKYKVAYHQCPKCDFIQTDEPFWLNEAYTDAISDADTGIIERNLKLNQIVPLIINSHFDKKAKFIDYGAGYGIFVRMMRDLNYDFWWQDEYCTNIFAKRFDIKTLPNITKFELLTAFEVFEHLQNPRQEIQKMLEYSDNILFSTTLTSTTKNLENWWYLSPETGQHIALYSVRTLKKIAQDFGLNFYTNGFNFHMLSKKKITPIIFIMLKVFYKIKLFFKPEISASQADRAAYLQY